MDKSKIKEAYGNINFLIGYIDRWGQVTESDEVSSNVKEIIPRLMRTAKNLEEVL